jgi:hypothetical protein
MHSDASLPSQRKPTKKNKKELPSFNSVSEEYFAMAVQSTPMVSTSVLVLKVLKTKRLFA